MELAKLTAIVGVVLLGLCGAASANPAAAGQPPKDDHSKALDSLEALQRSLLGESDGGGLFSGDVVKLGDDRPEAPQVIYRYKKRDGREVYTNIVDQVPEEQRATAAMDLSRVSLNSEIGRELEHKLSAQHGELAQTEYCVNLRDKAGQSFLDSLWKDYAPLLVCGGLLLAFLLFTPIALTKVSAPDWARVLSMAIPSLALAGVVSFTMMKTNETIVKARALAKPCETQTFKQLAQQDNPIGKQAVLVRRLQQQIGALDALAKSDGRTAQRGSKGR